MTLRDLATYQCNEVSAKVHTCMHALIPNCNSHRQRHNFKTRSQQQPNTITLAHNLMSMRQTHAKEESAGATTTGEIEGWEVMMGDGGELNFKH